MTPLNCQQLDPLLELYVLEETDLATRVQIHAHLDGCPRCRAELARARSLTGLLDLHFGQPAALGRLEQRLRRESRPRLRSWRTEPLVRPILSLAALLLVTLGLGLWLPASDDRQPTSPLSLVLEVEPLRLGPPALPVRGQRDPREIAVAQAKILPVDLAGKSLAAWKRAIEEGPPRRPLPRPPFVPLELTIHNPTGRPLRVTVGDRWFACRLDLRGKEVVRRLAAGDSPAGVKARKTWTIPPGGHMVLPWERLESVEDGYLEYLYPLSPGNYLLTAQLRVLVTLPGEKPRPVWLPRSGPLTIRVGDGTR